MKYLNPFIFICIIAIFTTGCVRNRKNTNVISVGYHSDNCEECNALKAKMKTMNRKFYFKPIVFIKYDQTNNNSKEKAEEKLKKWDILNIAQKEKELKHVVLYSSKTKKELERLNHDDSKEELEKKIRAALKFAK